MPELGSVTPDRYAGDQAGTELGHQHAEVGADPVGGQARVGGQTLSGRLEHGLGAGPGQGDVEVSGAHRQAERVRRTPGGGAGDVGRPRDVHAHRSESGDRDGDHARRVGDAGEHRRAAATHDRATVVGGAAPRAEPADPDALTRRVLADQGVRDVPGSSEILGVRHVGQDDEDLVVC